MTIATLKEFDKELKENLKQIKEEKEKKRNNELLLFKSDVTSDNFKLIYQQITESNEIINKKCTSSKQIHNEINLTRIHNGDEATKHTGIENIYEECGLTIPKTCTSPYYMLK